MYENSERLLTVAEAAELLHVSEKVLRRWILNKKIGWVKIGGTRYSRGLTLIPESQVEAKIWRVDLRTWEPTHSPRNESVEQACRNMHFMPATVEDLTRVYSMPKEKQQALQFAWQMRDHLSPAGEAAKQRWEQEQKAIRRDGQAKARAAKQIAKAKTAHRQAVKKFTERWGEIDTAEP